MGRFGADSENNLAGIWVGALDYFVYRCIVVRLVAFRWSLVNLLSRNFLDLRLRLADRNVVIGSSLVTTLLRFRKPAENASKFSGYNGYHVLNSMNYLFIFNY